MNRFYKFTAIILLVVALISFAGCSDGSSDSVSQQEEQKAVSVEVTPVTTGEISTVKEISGKIVTDADIPVIAPIAGKVTTVSVSIGDIVKDGQVLFVLDKDDIEKQYRPLKDNYDRTKAIADSTLTMLRKNVDDLKALFEVGAASQMEIDGAELELASQEAQFASTLDSLKTNMDSINDMLKNASITAPADGVVTSISVVEGGVASQASPALIISKIDVVSAQISVSESLLPSIYVGQNVTVTVPSLEGSSYEAAVTSISPATNAYTQLYDINISIDNTDGRLRAGTFVNVTVPTGTRSDAILVPSEALTTIGGKQALFTADNGIAHRIYVETGSTNKGMTEIISGVSDGESVVTKGQSFLDDGSAITIVGG